MSTAITRPCQHDGNNRILKGGKAINSFVDEATLGLMVCSSALRVHLRGPTMPDVSAKKKNFTICRIPVRKKLVLDVEC